MRRRRPRVWIKCCGVKQVCHQYAGDYRLCCKECGKESWATPPSTAGLEPRG